MEIDPLGLNPPSSTRSNQSPHEPPRRDLSTRNQWSLKHGIRDAKSRSPTYGKEADKSARFAARTPVTGSKRLVPASEKRSGGQDGAKSKDEADGEKWNMTPDGGSAGREGRNFTVANVGSNGQIFLRPTVRPANQRYPQPNFVFPITPPSTAGLDSLAHKQSDEDETSELQSSQLTPSPLADSQSPGMIRKKAYFDLRSTKTRHRRAMSDSTIQEGSVAHESDTGAFKVVISKPKEEPKSRTTDDIEADEHDLLQISIPSWKLGTPRFTMRGTPLIRGSSYAPTEDVRASSITFRGSQRDRNSLHPQPLDARKSSSPSPRIQVSSPGLLSPATITSPQFPVPLRSTYLSTHLLIEPAMFDALTFKPACDDRSIVRYSSNTNAVTAATPPRLVAEITSPTFLDYELISDFFLTFRSFLEPLDLLRMLIARLRWALARDDETGMVVRVRTFVALRHWILNYFVDDFVVDYHLRVTFCNLLNDLVDELSHDQRERKVQLKILAELKKCWRRVCSQYWDGPEFESFLGPDIPIAPGGIAGHRDPSLDPSFWETESEDPPQIYGVQLPDRDSRPDDSFYADVSKAGYIDSILMDGPRPATPERPTDMQRQQTSPISIASLDVVSCSFPTKNFRMGDPNMSLPLAAHPADPSSIYTTADPIAATPRALTGKRVRPQTSHRRNNSLTDFLRDHGTTTEKVLFKNAEFLLTLPYAGSLVRGNLLPPGQPFVEVEPQDSLGAARQTTVLHPQPTTTPKGKPSASAMSGQGMRKLIGGVRRALSTRGQGVSPTQGNFIDIAPLGPRGATTNRLPGTAIVPQACRPRPNGTRAAVRIDFLGADVAEDFKKAVREDAADGVSADGTAPREPPAEGIEYSAAHLDSSFELRPVSDAAITTGSKSIVIVDGTLPEGHPALAGALSALNPSVEAFAETMMPNNNANPTPPTTPPSQDMHGDTPRRSSYILGQHVYDPSLDVDPLPPFDPNILSKETGRQSEDAHSAAGPSINFFGESPNKTPSSYLRHHKRQQSSRSCRSKSSLAHRRWASFQSGIAAQSTIRSFDATTYSEGSVKSVAMPPPLRVLRRKPGGDLRGATNVADLDTLPLQKSRSVGSLTAYSESFRSSYLRSPQRDSSGFVDVVNSDYSPNRADIFSLGAMAEQAGKRPLSLFSTHSSKPVMRPSFEVEAQKLAQIPDDEDDGGIEAALLKLEGKYDKRILKLSMQRSKISVQDVDKLDDNPGSTPAEEYTEEEKRKHRHQHVGEDEVPMISPLEPPPNGQLDVPRHSEVSFLSEDSRGTYNSTPLLDRGLTDDGCSRADTREWTNHSILEGPDTPLEETADALTSSSQQPSTYEFVNKTESMDKIKAGETAPKPTEHDSFLDMNSDAESELSSEMSGELVDAVEDEFDLRPLSPRKPGPPSIVNDGAWYTSDDNHSSPQLTFSQALQISPGTGKVPELHEHQLWSQKPLPPTPDTTPTTAMYHQALEFSTDPTGTQEALRHAPKLSGESRRDSSAHLPFILAFDSEILAEQFTLIEKDALNEVDWKELIEMKWKNSNNDSRSWVDFLRNTDARGVEVVIARFNIMVKWCISEIVLTQNLEERARCIIKYLHIAAHCRRYRNFATMSQITIALTSNEIGRLSRTWARIPPTDMRTMNELETLVSPTKNFYNLRAEMEGGGNAADTGCIPFVGIYTHDLLFNSQRPSEIASSPNTAPLVNFERCRIAASVVKTLLRLLEASTYYQFQPIEGITERCLWMGALGDDEIRRHSESLE